MTDNGKPLVRVRTLQDAVALVPHLTGFHPADSLIVLCVRDRRVVFAARADLPDLDATPAEFVILTDRLVQAARRSRTEQVFLIGYGEHDRVDALMGPTAVAMQHTAITVLAVVRVHQGLIHDPLGDDPPEPVDAAAATAVAALLTDRAVLPSRAALAATLDPIAGAAAKAMHQALATAADEMQRILAAGQPGQPAAQAGTDLDPGARDHAIARAADRLARDAYRTVIARHHEHRIVSDDEAARLLLLMSATPIPLYALGHAHPDQTPLWMDMVRRAPGELAADPACLLAACAHLAGDGALAQLALDRAQQAEPDNLLLAALRDALDQAAPPKRLAALLALARDYHDR